MVPKDIHSKWRLFLLEVSDLSGSLALLGQIATGNEDGVSGSYHPGCICTIFNS